MILSDVTDNRCARLEHITRPKQNLKVQYPACYMSCISPWAFQKKIYAYYRHHARRFPWRKTRDPYRILVSEIMLQQTQASRVVRAYKAFLAVFPDIHALARAPMYRVLRVWSGLGYNRRAFALKKTARVVVEMHSGRIPNDRDTLLSLPGIGPATAGAILAFAFNKPAVFLETNIRSVFIHHFFSKRDRVYDRDILPYIKKTLDIYNPRQWYWALMDYGVMLKEKHENPSRKSRHYVKQSPFSGSVRQLRGRILRIIAEAKSILKSDLIDTAAAEVPKVEAVLRQLEKERLIVLRSGRFFISS